MVADGYFAAWWSLSRLLPSITNLRLGGGGHLTGLKSLNMRLQPCPRPLIHLTELKIRNSHFHSFPALFQDIGALRSLQTLKMHEVQWNGACDPSSPPWSTDTFCSIKAIDAENCTELWPFVWIFTTSLLRYRQPQHAPDIGENVLMCNVHANVHAIVNAARALCST